MDNDLSRTQHRTMIAVYDFDEAREYLNSIRKDTSDALKAAAILAAVIAYSRPFKTSRAGKDNKALKKLHLPVESVLSAEEVTLHERILEIRDSAIAHSDFDYKQSFIIEETTSGYSFGSIQTHTYLFDLNIDKLKAIAEKFSKKSRIESYDLQMRIRKANEQSALQSQINHDETTANKPNLKLHN